VNVYDATLIYFEPSYKTETLVLLARNFEAALKTARRIVKKRNCSEDLVYLSKISWHGGVDE